MTDYYILMDERGYIATTHIESDAYALFDDPGIIWKGDLVLVKELARRR